MCLGFQVCFPRLDFYSSGSKKMVEWLKNRHLPPLLQLEYGKCGLAIFSQNVLEKEVKEYSENLRNWLDQHNVGIVVCSGFVAEPLVVPSEERLVFMGLYPPWGYGLSEMTYIRDRLDGLFSDSVWAAEKWGEGIGAPVDWGLFLMQPGQL